MKSDKSRAKQIFARLAAIAPQIEFSQSRELDGSPWEGTGPNPARKGMRSYSVTFTARTVHLGRLLEAHTYLGNSYFRPSDPMGTVGGFLLQKLEEAAGQLLTALHQPGANAQFSACSEQLAAAIAYLTEEMHLEWEDQQAKSA